MKNHYFEKVDVPREGFLGCVGRVDTVLQSQSPFFLTLSAVEFHVSHPLDRFWGRSETI